MGRTEQRTVSQPRYTAPEGNVRVSTSRRPMRSLEETPISWRARSGRASGSSRRSTAASTVRPPSAGRGPSEHRLARERAALDRQAGHLGGPLGDVDHRAGRDRSAVRAAIDASGAARLPQQVPRAHSVTQQAGCARTAPDAVASRTSDTGRRVHAACGQRRTVDRARRLSATAFVVVLYADFAHGQLAARVDWLRGWATASTGP
jgi:hypothetical protein